MCALAPARLSDPCSPDTTAAAVSPEGTAALSNSGSAPFRAGRLDVEHVCCLSRSSGLGKFCHCPKTWAVVGC